MSGWFPHTPTIELRAELRRAETRRRFFANRDAAAQRQNWAFFESCLKRERAAQCSKQGAIYLAWQNRLHRRLRNP